MTRRGFALAVIILAMLAVCALGTSAMYASLRALRRSGARIPIGSGEVAATSRETRSYDLGIAPRLVVDTAVGGITVTVGADDAVLVETVRTAWGEDAAAARTALADLHTEADAENDTLTLSYKAKPDVVVVLTGRHRVDTVGFNLTVPPSASVDLKVGSGSMRVDGTRGGATARSSSGGIEIDNAGGDIDVETSSGAIAASGLRCDGPVRLATDFGEVKLDRSEVGEIEIVNGSGSVTIDDVAVVGRIALTSRFGSIALDSTTAADFAIDTQSGDIAVAAAHQTGGQGTLRLRTGFGAIRVTETSNVALDAESSSGEVSFSGSLLADRPHRLVSRFGDVRAAIPAESSFGVLLATDFGAATCELPVTTREKVSETRIEGAIGRGGPLLQLTTSSGDVRLTALGGATRP